MSKNDMNKYEYKLGKIFEGISYPINKLYCNKMSKYSVKHILECLDNFEEVLTTRKMVQDHILYDIEKIRYAVTKINTFEKDSYDIDIFVIAIAKYLERLKIIANECDTKWCVK